MTSKKLAELIAETALDNKAEDIIILDMREIVNFCDFFVICTGSSDRRIRSLGDAIEEEVEKNGLKVRHTKGAGVKNWVLIDTGDVVTHIFDQQSREFYGLEHLWQNAPRVERKK